MLEKLQIHNFQKHRRLSLKFSPSITTLVGDSRRGKSSAFRAIRLVAQGGSCTGLVTHGEESFWITLHADSHRIKRTKSKEENSYTLDTRESYRAVRQDVPEEISKILGVSDINFQSQFDAPFWLSLTPSEAARELNKVVSLDLIDSTLSTLSSELRKAQHQEEFCKKRVEESEKRLEELHWVPAAQKDYGVVESLEQELGTLTERISILNGLLEEAQSYSKGLEDSDTLLEKSRELADYLEKYTIVTQRVTELEHLLRECESIRNTIKDWNEKLNEAERQLHELQTDQCPLCGK